MKVRVLGNLNSGQYSAGDVIELPDDEAKSLLELAAVELLDEAAQLDENTNAADTNINTPPVDPPAPAAPDQPADGGSANDVPLDNPPETVNPAAGSPESAPTSQDSPSQPDATADPQQPAAPEQVPAPAPQPTPEDIAQTIASTETSKA